MRARVGNRRCAGHLNVSRRPLVPYRPNAAKPCPAPPHTHTAFVTPTRLARPGSRPGALRPPPPARSPSRRVSRPHHSPRHLAGLDLGHNLQVARLDAHGALQAHLRAGIQRRAVGVCQESTSRCVCMCGTTKRKRLLPKHRTLCVCVLGNGTNRVCERVLCHVWSMRKAHEWWCPT